MYGDSGYVSKLCYLIILFGAVVLGLRVLDWYYAWPW
jgi:hypothetical protein